MIFDAFSNAAYRMSLRGQGAEDNPSPPAGGKKSRGPAGRGLTRVGGIRRSLLDLCLKPNDAVYQSALVMLIR